MTAEGKYGAESIKVLEGLEGVRRRPRNVYRKYWKRRVASFNLRGC